VTEQMNNPFTAISREYVKEIWQTSKRALGVMRPDDQLLAFVMQEHEEYLTYWENIDQYMDYEFDPETEVNPFLHVSVHQLVEGQIRNESPPEVERVFQALKERGTERHDAIHLIGSVLVEHMFSQMQSQQEFNVGEYIEDLNGLLRQS
jgi:hypothetical protein